MPKTKINSIFNSLFSFISTSLLVLIANYIGSFFSYFFHIIVGKTNTLPNFSQIESLLSLSFIITIFAGAIGPSIINLLSSTPDSTTRHHLDFINRSLFKLAIILLLLLIALYLPLQLFLHLDNILLYLLFIIQSLATLYLTGYQSVLQSKFKIKSYLFLGVFLAITKNIFAYLLSFTLLSSLNSNLGLTLSVLITLAIYIILINQFWPKTKSSSPSSTNYSSFWTFSKLSLPVNLFLSLLFIADTLFARHFFTPDRSAYFYTISLISKIIFFSTSTVLVFSFPMFIKNRLYPTLLRNDFVMSLFFTLILGTLIFILFSLFPNLVVNILYGYKFHPGASYLPLYSFYFLLYSIFYFLSQFLLSQNIETSYYIPALAFFIQLILIILFHYNEQTLIISSTISLFVGIILATISTFQCLTAQKHHLPVYK